jgi:hypothetical protein
LDSAQRWPRSAQRGGVSPMDGANNPTHLRKTKPAHIAGFLFLARSLVSPDSNLMFDKEKTYASQAQAHICQTTWAQCHGAKRHHKNQGPYEAHNDASVVLDTFQPRYLFNARSSRAAQSSCPDAVASHTMQSALHPSSSVLDGIASEARWVQRTHLYFTQVHSLKE